MLRDLSVNVLSVNEDIEDTSADSDLVRRWRSARIKNYARLVFGRFSGLV